MKVSYCSSLRCRFWLSSQFVCVFHSSASIEFQYFNEKKKKKIKKSPVGNLRTLLLNIVIELGGACVLSRFRRVRLFATPWTLACQAPLSMEFFRQEYWSGLPVPFSRTRWWSGSSSCSWKSHLDLKSYFRAVWSGSFLSLIFSFGKGVGGVPPLGFHEDCTEKGAHSSWTHSRCSAMIILLTISYHCCTCMLGCFSCVSFFATLWTMACQAPRPLGILQARILEWVGLAPLQGIFLTQESNSRLLRLLHWQVGSLTTSGAR